MNNNFNFNNGGDANVVINTSGELMMKVVGMLINLIMFILTLPFWGTMLAREMLKSDTNQDAN